MLLLALFSAAVAGCSGAASEGEVVQTRLNRIAFGSCASQNEPQPIWKAVLQADPDLFLFLGDNIYADTRDMQVMREKYAKLADKPGYQRLMETCPVLSTWDDHDYGVNDGGRSYSRREESEQIFLDFFDVPKDSPRRQRPGVYGAHRFGPPGERVQIILLDTRYFKDAEEQVANPAPDSVKRAENLVGWYLPTDDTTTTLLGEAQWRWLEQQLRKEADLRLIVSSIQVVAHEKGMESWGNYPHERQRLFDLIGRTDADGVLFLSGDVHFSELSRTEESPYPMYDFTSSGMTHAVTSWAEAVNSYRVGDAYADLNFGLVSIDWERDDPLIHLKAFGKSGDLALHHAVRLSELSSGG